MVVGESQILGQVRARAARRAGRGHAARALLNELFAAGAAGRQARPHRDRHRPGRPLARLGRRSPLAPRVLGGLAEARGAGRRRRLDELAGRHDVAPRRRRRRHDRQPHAPSARERLAAPVGGAAPVTLDRARGVRSPTADLVVSCTGAVGPWSSTGRRAAAPARACRPAAGRPRPGPAARRRPGRRTTSPVSRSSTSSRSRAVLADAELAADVEAVRGDRRRRGRRVPRRPARRRSRPTVVALRAHGRRRRRRRAGPARRPAARPGRRARARRSSRPCAASSTSCCTRRPCGSRSSPASPAATATPTRCASCSTSTPTRSTPSRGPSHRRRRAASSVTTTDARCGSGTRRSALAHRPVATWSPTPSPAHRPRRRARRDHHRGRRSHRAARRRSAAPASSSPRCATRCSPASIDFAVHSLKDLPTAPADGLVLAAMPLREDPRDALVARDGLHPRRAAGRLARRHRLAAPRRAAACARPRPRRRRRSAATSTPGSR